MSSAGPVLLGRVRCALDGPVKAAAGDVDVTDVPGSPSELDSPIRSRDQSQTWWIQRWTHRTFLCVAVIVAACLSGALACELYRSSSYKSDSIFLVCPNATPASGSTLFDAQLAWRIMLPVSTRVQAACLGL